MFDSSSSPIVSMKGSYVIYVIYVCLHIVVFNTQCGVSLFRLSSFVTGMVSISELFILDYPSVFSNVYIYACTYIPLITQLYANLKQVKSMLNFTVQCFCVLFVFGMCLVYLILLLYLSLLTLLFFLAIIYQRMCLIISL